MPLWIGTSGWSYPHWRGAFYPERLPARRELEYASQRFRSLEINRSFYALLTAKSCAAWREATPPDFRFALKGSRFITHAKKLREVSGSLANFFASGPLALGKKLGPVVWQLPPSLGFDAERMEAFFALLPRNTEQAAELAARHDARVKDPFVEPGPKRRLRHAVEPRHASFSDPAFARLAARYRVGVAIADSASWPAFDLVTSDFVYVRLHGSEQTYASAYRDEQLEHWARRIRRWLERGAPQSGSPERASTPRVRGARDRVVREVYVYFDNDAEVHAPRDAERLRTLLADLDPAFVR